MKKIRSNWFVVVMGTMFLATCAMMVMAGGGASRCIASCHEEADYDREYCGQISPSNQRSCLRNAAEDEARCVRDCRNRK